MFSTFGLWAQAPGEGGKIWEYKVGGFITLSSAAVSPDGSKIYVGVTKDFGVGNSNGLVAVSPSADSREGWKITLPGGVDSSPAVSADGRTVYVGCGDGKLYAFDTATQRKKWETASFVFISSSPAIGADGTIYVGAWDWNLHAIDPDTGKERPGFPFATHGIIDLSSPAIGKDGTIYIGSRDKNVYAVTPEGAAKWEAPYSTGGIILSSPAIGADGTIYIGSSDQFLHAISPDGKRKWAFFTNDDIQSSPVLGADGTVYIASVDTHLYALNPNGSDDQRVKWIADIGATTASTPIVRGDGVIILGADDGIVHAFNPDGKPRWNFNTKTGDTSDIIDASPIVAPDGSIYIGSTNGMLYKIRGNGSPLSAYSSWPAFHRDITHSGRALATGSGQLLNLSTRAEVSGTGTLIAGVVVHGVSAKAYLMRGVGPTLAQYGVGNPMSDPRLDFFNGGVLMFRNDNWGEPISPSVNFGLVETARAVGAFPLPEGSKDAALVAPLGPGLYTAHVTSSVEGQGGVVLLEVYDVPSAGDPTSRIVNLSTRGHVGTNGNVLIPGIVVGGTGAIRLLVRGVGPGLAQFGVGAVLAQPEIAVFSGARRLDSNRGWTTTGLKNDLSIAAQQVGAFALADGSADCALILDANPGEYTIQVSGVSGTTGEALVEIYVLP